MTAADRVLNIRGLLRPVKRILPRMILSGPGGRRADTPSVRGRQTPDAATGVHRPDPDAAPTPRHPAPGAFPGAPASGARFAMPLPARGPCARVDSPGGLS